MRTGPARQRSRKLIASILLVALAFRALVPAGFMPAANHPFSLEICPDGFPAQLLHSGMDHEHGMHHSKGAAHSHYSAQSEHCVFAAVTSAGPATYALAVRLPLDSSFTPLFDGARCIYRAQRFRVHQPRAPPLPA
jgi:hypothetical protein